MEYVKSKLEHNSVLKHKERIVFSIGIWTFSLDNENARAVILRSDFGHVQKLPQMTKPLIGVSNISGHAVPVLDVGDIFDSSDSDKKRNILLLGNKNKSIAVLIDGLPKNFTDIGNYKEENIDHLDIPEYVKELSQYAWRKKSLDGSDENWIFHLSDFDNFISKLKLN